MNTKKIPMFIMLLAGAVCVIVTYLNHYNLHDMLIALLVVLLVFLIVGAVIKFLFDKFEISTDDDISDEGEVVEKPNEGELAEENPEEGADLSDNAEPKDEETLQ